MSFGGALIFGRWGLVGCGRKSYLGSTEGASFSSRDFSRSNKHDTLTWCINWIFLCFIFVSHCCFKFSSHGNFKKLRPSLVYYHFYSQQPCRPIFINIFICFKYYTVWNQFFLSKYTLRFFISKCDLNLHCSYLF